MRGRRWLSGVSRWLEREIEWVQQDLEDHPEVLNNLRGWGSGVGEGNINKERERKTGVDDYDGEEEEDDWEEDIDDEEEDVAEEADDEEEDDGDEEDDDSGRRGGTAKRPVGQKLMQRERVSGGWVSYRPVSGILVSRGRARGRLLSVARMRSILGIGGRASGGQRSGRRVSGGRMSGGRAIWTEAVGHDTSRGSHHVNPISIGPTDRPHFRFRNGLRAYVEDVVDHKVSVKLSELNHEAVSGASIRGRTSLRFKTDVKQWDFVRQEGDMLSQPSETQHPDPEEVRRERDPDRRASQPHEFRIVRPSTPGPGGRHTAGNTKNPERPPSGRKGKMSKYPRATPSRKDPKSQHKRRQFGWEDDVDDSDGQNTNGRFQNDSSRHGQTPQQQRPQHAWEDDLDNNDDCPTPRPYHGKSIRDVSTAQRQHPHHSWEDGMNDNNDYATRAPNHGQSSRRGPTPRRQRPKPNWVDDIDDGKDDAPDSPDHPTPDKDDGVTQDIKAMGRIHDFDSAPDAAALHAVHATVEDYVPSDSGTEDPLMMVRSMLPRSVNFMR